MLVDAVDAVLMKRRRYEVMVVAGRGESRVGWWRNEVEVRD